MGFVLVVERGGIERERERERVLTAVHAGGEGPCTEQLLCNELTSLAQLPHPVEHPPISSSREATVSFTCCLKKTEVL